MRPKASHISLLGATLWALGLQLLVLSPAGCDSEVDILNGTPQVTWVAVEPSAAPQQEPARITLWVADFEGDSVDVVAEWVDAAGQAQPLVESVGSYGLVGLTTRDALFEADGQPHLVLWDVSDVPAGADVKLRFRPDDRPFDSDEGLGTEVESPSFSVDVGLPEATELAPSS